MSRPTTWEDSVVMVVCSSVARGTVRMTIMPDHCASFRASKTIVNRTAFDAKDSFRDAWKEEMISVQNTGKI